MLFGTVHPQHSGSGDSNASSSASAEHSPQNTPPSDEVINLAATVDHRLLIDDLTRDIENLIRSLKNPADRNFLTVGLAVEEAKREAEAAYTITIDTFKRESEERHAAQLNKLIEKAKREEELAAEEVKRHTSTVVEDTKRQAAAAIEEVKRKTASKIENEQRSSAAAVEKAKRDTAAAAAEAASLLAAQVEEEKEVASHIAEIDRAVAVADAVEAVMAEAAEEKEAALRKAAEEAEAARYEAVEDAKSEMEEHWSDKMAQALAKAEEDLNSALRAAEDAKADALTQAADKATQEKEAAVKAAIAAASHAGVQCVVCMDAGACQMPFRCRHVLMCHVDRCSAHRVYASTHTQGQSNSAAPIRVQIACVRTQCVMYLHGYDLKPHTASTAHPTLHPTRFFRFTMLYSEFHTRLEDNLSHFGLTTVDIFRTPPPPTAAVLEAISAALHPQPLTLPRGQRFMDGLSPALLLYAATHLSALQAENDMNLTLLARVEQERLRVTEFIQERPAAHTFETHTEIQIERAQEEVRKVKAEKKEKVRKLKREKKEQEQIFLEQLELAEERRYRSGIAKSSCTEQRSIKASASAVSIRLSAKCRSCASTSTCAKVS
ncbi:hypothetical protein CC85DRAFT_323305 [Cutaneotrichosporon oleaginosum]|uniref:Uncharacterized protein n=1 Tax=Cutaneotrichosporon oleaginosum TaxID=879819 RepID=A0A0J0XF19_9TREE|nr:uncharacterized protein CC85DRAFT_323305 [Cutaneotrichosporon oleaginosum]KLT39665.1 hypothetical protein CC85DRAFT_323305 [Cutaneotrichosporon oleaginosum]TXT07028.1 hypothetical protein COLE_06359 [Cutaneotrichosporon oleaginosum]